MKIKKTLLPLDLQFFAEEINVDDSIFEGLDVGQEKPVPTEGEGEAKTTEEEATEDEEVDDEGTDGDDTSDDEVNPEGTEKKDDAKTVPLATHIQERTKLKDQIKALQKENELVKKLAVASGKTPEQMLQEIDEIQIQNQVAKGIDPSTARQNLENKKKVDEALREVRKEKRDIEVSRLKADPLYSDIDLYRDEVEELADLKEISLDQAYLLLRGPQKMKEMQYQNQYRNPSKKVVKKVNTTQSSETKVPTYETELTNEEREVAKMAGMTAKEFYEMKKIDGLDSYQKMKSKK